jgi:hypothetical protein
MVLIPQKGGWMARLRSNKETVELPLSAKELGEAVAEAEQLYADLRAISSGRATCQGCVHWKFVNGDCSLGFPEGRRTGGKYAAECPAFWLSV